MSRIKHIFGKIVWFMTAPADERTPEQQRHVVYALIFIYALIALFVGLVYLAAA